MGIYGALFSGVSGLKAQAQNMGIISDNISNANTVGYKNSTNNFQTLVTTPATSTTYSPGGVLSRPFAHVDQQGLLQASSSRTDVGVSGRGFLPVTNSVTTGGALKTTVSNTYTRAGSFTVDKNGNLVNSAGFFLLGVPINQTTGLPSISNPAVQTLSLVNVGTLTGIAKGTSTLSIGANLPAVPTVSSPLAIGGTIGTTSPALVAGNTDLNTYTIYSSAGKAYTLSNVQYNLGAASATSRTVTVTATINNPAGNSAPNATAITLGTFTTTPTGSTFTAGTGATFADGTTYTPAIDGSALTLATGATDAISTVTVDPQDVTAVVYDSLGVANNLTIEFGRQQYGLTTTASTNNWVGKIKSMTVVATGASATSTTLPILLDGTADLGTTAATAVTQSGALVKFNTNGTVASSPTSFASATGLVLNDGAAAFGGTGFTLNLGTSGTPSGLTQYSSTFSVSFLNQNGLAFSFRTGVAFDTNGTVSAVFDNGTTIPLYKIPLVNFSNVNALQAETGNVYAETTESGSNVANFAGLGGTGTFAPSTLEASNVDLSTEFANMIITQRSFSANARTITTADAELNEIVNLVR
jgi:flagellar hook protein FlgE